MVIREVKPYKATMTNAMNKSISIERQTAMQMNRQSIWMYSCLSENLDKLLNSGKFGTGFADSLAVSNSHA